MVSRHGHCLNDLLFRCQSGQLNAEIAAVVSNHPDFADLCASHGVAFHHLALPTGAGADAKRAQERQVEGLVESQQIDLVVLARYMQILSGEFCEFLKGARSTSTTASCPASRARSLTTRRTSAA